MMPPAAEDPQHNDCNDPDIACDSPLARSTTIESTTYIRKAAIRSWVTMLLDNVEVMREPDNDIISKESG
jgi:hypothetical protein